MLDENCGGAGSAPQPLVLVEVQLGECQAGERHGGHDRREEYHALDAAAGLVRALAASAQQAGAARGALLDQDERDREDASTCRFHFLQSSCKVQAPSPSSRECFIRRRQRAKRRRLALEGRRAGASLDLPHRPREQLREEAIAPVLMNDVEKRYRMK